MDYCSFSVQPRKDDDILLLLEKGENRNFVQLTNI